MDNAQQPANWNQFLSVVKTKLDEQHLDSGRVLSTLYSYTAEEKGTHFEGLRDAIADVSNTYGLGLSGNNIENIFQTAPFLVSDSSLPVTPEENEHIRESDHTSSDGGMPSLINRDKYETDINDKLAQQAQENAVEELRKSQEKQLSQEQIEQAKKEALEKLNKTQLSATEEGKAIEDFKRKEAFKEILIRNQTADATIQEQHELLAKQLEKSEEGVQLKEGQLSAAERVRRRSGELMKERAEQRKEFSEIDPEAVKQLANKKKLTDAEITQLRRYRYLRSLDEREKRSNIRNIDGWTKRFDRLDRNQQEILLRKLLARQHRRVHWDVWKIFEQKQVGKHSKTPLKTLSRHERRNLLAYQKAELQKKQQSAMQKISILRRILSMLSQESEIDSQYVSSEFSDYRGSNNGGGGSGFNPFDIYQRGKSMYDNFNKAKNAFNYLRNLGQGAEALGGGSGAAAGGAGAAGAGAGAAGGGLAAAAPWIALAIVIILIIVLIIILLLQNPTPSNPYTPLSCGDEDSYIPYYQKESSFFVENGSIAKSGMDKILNDYFGMTFLIADHNNQIITTQDSYFAVALSNAKSFLTTTCLLYGHISSQKYAQNYANTFGSYLIGKQVKNPYTVKVAFEYTDKSTAPQCYPDVRKGNAQIILIDYINLNKCTSDNQLSFRVAQGLSQALILQQQLAAAQSNIFTSFKTAVTSKGKLTTIPTQQCLTQTGDNQYVACFDDMVGSYLTYPYYIDLITTNRTDFSDYKDSYPTYYNFAKTNLFDGVEFINLQLTSADIQSVVGTVESIMSCEVDKEDRYHAPPPGCVNTLTISQDFKTSLNNSYPFFQCGSFIIHAQTLLKWPHFGDNNNSVYGWYTYRPDHSQDGYTFIPNKERGSDLQDGDIIIYRSTKSSDPGHTAMVMSVQRDLFHFRVMEANYVGGVTWFRNTALDDDLGRGANIVGWYRRKV